MAEDKNIALDEDAQRLFEQFGGMQAYDKSATQSGAQRVTQGLLEEQKRHDAVRILMIQATRLISHYFANPQFCTESSQEPKVFSNLTKVLAKLNGTSGHLGCLLIRYRGVSNNPDIPEKYDYEVVFGHTVVDTAIVPNIVRRNGAQLAKLPDQLLSAFAGLANYGVNNIFIRLPQYPERHLPILRLCLKILSGFRVAQQNETQIQVRAQNDTRTVAVIKDENMFADPNLTLLAGINRLNPKSMETLVNKVDRLLRQKGTELSSKRFAGVYNAALEVPKIREQVKKPLVELNNIKWLISDSEDQVIPVQKVRIAKLAMALESASPQKVAKMIQSVYGEDYAKINNFLLGERLHLSSHLLSAAENRSQKVELMEELLSNLQTRLDQVKDHVIDEIHVVQDTAKERQDGKEPPKEAVHGEIYKMVEFYKGRSTTRKKMVGMVNKPIDFSEEDYRILAKDFKIEIEDAHALVGKLKSCFNNEGRFKKSGFAEAIGHFQKYEQKIFHFLWHHMKDVVQPQDRTAFLNALQGLTTQMNQPKKAFKILLEDLCEDPDAVQHSDNKAIMLSNLILHSDKSLTDYDMTPEDIVLSRHRVDPEVMQYAAWRIEKEHEAFSTKIQTIHKKMTEALQLGQTSQKRIPAGMLLNLERELYIFLSLVECEVGRAILRSAASEYGDPAAEIYTRKESLNNLGLLMQNLRVAIRGVGSVGTTADAPYIEKIKVNEEDFKRLKNDRHHRAQARLLTEWVDEAIKMIKFRC